MTTQKSTVIVLAALTAIATFVALTFLPKHEKPAPDFIPLKNTIITV